MKFEHFKKYYKHLLIQKSRIQCPSKYRNNINTDFTFECTIQKSTGCIIQLTAKKYSTKPELCQKIKIVRHDMYYLNNKSQFFDQELINSIGTESEFQYSTLYTEEILNAAKIMKHVYDSIGVKNPVHNNIHQNDVLDFFQYTNKNNIRFII